MVPLERADRANPSVTAFTVRVIDPVASGQVKVAAERDVAASECGDGYRSHLVGTVDLNRYARMWIGHARDAGVKAI